MSFGQRHAASTIPVDPAAQKRLQALPNVGPKVAAQFVRAGITDITELAGQDPDVLFEALCAVDGVRHDDRMRDIFAAAISIAEGNPPLPWSAFTAARKARDAARAAAPGDAEDAR